MMGKKLRYPGSKPFEEGDRMLFFGREDDIERLTQLVKVEPLLVLYGKSGLGKSSLLNAGVVPRLQESDDFEVCSVRFGSYMEGQDMPTPLDRVLRKMREDRRKQSFLRKISHNNRSLWQTLKSLQVAEERPNRTFIFLFDQFEELFTYPEKDIREFKSALVDVLNSAVPQDFRQALKAKMEVDEHVLTKEELGAIYQPMAVHVVLTIRSDKMSLLNRLRDQLPNVLQRVYELRPLTPEQAEDAILGPAALRDSDAFLSPTFDYQDAALDKILNFLTKGNEKAIESFQLQILCQYIEETLVIAQYDTSISAEDIGDLESIYQNYYDNQMAKLPTDAERQKARRLIEEGLIFEEEERRLSVYEGQIRSSYGIDQSLLTKLVDTHIIRSEPNQAGGFSYEISHDTLVAPILRSKERRRGEEEARRREEERERIRAAERAEHRAEIRKRQRAFLIFVFCLALPFAAWEIYKTYNENKDLENEKQKLILALDELDSTKQVNDMLATTDKEKLIAEIELWKNRYQGLLDSVASIEQDVHVHIDSADRVAILSRAAALESNLDALKERNKSMQQQLREYERQRLGARNRLRELNRRLYDDLWKTEYKSNAYWIRLKEGIIKDYQTFEQELR
jgi:hypothetical protein